MTHILLICTVGGSPRPVAVSLAHWKPARVLFVPSNETQGSIERDSEFNGAVTKSLLGQAKDEGFEIGPGAYDIHTLSDGQDLERCLREVEGVSVEVDKWRNKGDGYEIGLSKRFHGCTERVT